MDSNTEIDRVQEFVDKGNYHAAINIAISAMNDCRKHENQQGIDTFIEIMRGIINTMAGKFGSQV